MSNKRNGHDPSVSHIKAAPEPVQQPQRVAPGGLAQPGPLLTTVATALLPQEDEAGAVRPTPFVVVRVESLTGMTVLFLSPHHARALAAQLSENAALAATGLHVARPGDLPTL